MLGHMEPAAGGRGQRRMKGMYPHRYLDGERKKVRKRGGRETDALLREPKRVKGWIGILYLLREPCYPALQQKGCKCTRPRGDLHCGHSGRCVWVGGRSSRLLSLASMNFEGMMTVF